MPVEPAVEHLSAGEPPAGLGGGDGGFGGGRLLAAGEEAEAGGAAAGHACQQAVRQIGQCRLDRGHRRIQAPRRRRQVVPSSAKQVGQHLRIGILAVEKLRSLGLERLHSRKLRSLAEAAFQ